MELGLEAAGVGAGELDLAFGLLQLFKVLQVEVPQLQELLVLESQSLQFQQLFRARVLFTIASRGLCLDLLFFECFQFVLKLSPDVANHELELFPLLEAG